MTTRCKRSLRTDVVILTAALLVAASGLGPLGCGGRSLGTPRADATADVVDDGDAFTGDVPDGEGTRDMVDGSDLVDTPDTADTPDTPDTVDTVDTTLVDTVVGPDTMWTKDVDTTGLETVVSGPAEVVQTGTAGLLLRGVVLGPQGVLDPGEVLVEGALITCVAADCSGAAGAATAIVIETHGTISPGLIDAHNHMSYNFLPEWLPGRTFQNRYEWANDPGYEEHILPYSAHRSANSHFCPASRWGELRSLIHGTTTMQGQPSAAGSCIDGLVRNPNRYHGLGYDHMRGTIGSVRDITDADSQGYVDSFLDAVAPTTRFLVHMCEGVSGDHVEEEFDSFAGRDPRSNRHAGQSLLDYGTAVLIHSIILQPDEIDEAAATGSMVVWSPSSNFALYGLGHTAPIQQILQKGITTGLGPDWTPSGADEMLGELRVALDYALRAEIGELTPEKLWRMATSDGATVVGLDADIGSLRVGQRADIAVFGRTASEPHMAVIDSRAQDVRLVLINGEGYFGDQSLQSATGRNGYCEAIDACGAPKFICASEDGTELVGDTETLLYNILEGIGYPANEQYGRGDELLPLIQCE